MAGQKLTDKDIMKGFTLVEILVSALIFSFLIAAIFGVLNIGNMTYSTDLGLLDLQQKARQAMDGMIRELRQSGSSDITITDSGARIQFRIPTDITTDPVTYSSNITYYLSDNQLIREHPAGTTKILADNINSLTFSLSEKTLEIRLNAKKTSLRREIYFPPKEDEQERFLIEKVRLRNE